MKKHLTAALLVLLTAALVTAAGPPQAPPAQAPPVLRAAKAGCPDCGCPCPGGGCTCPAGGCNCPDCPGRSSYRKAFDYSLRTGIPLAVWVRQKVRHYPYPVWEDVRAEDDGDYGPPGPGVMLAYLPYRGADHLAEGPWLPGAPTKDELYRAVTGLPRPTPSKPTRALAPVTQDWDPYAAPGGCHTQPVTTYQQPAYFPPPVACGQPIFGPVPFFGGGGGFRFFGGARTGGGGCGPSG
jgi:hypothetical protein